MRYYTVFLYQNVVLCKRVNSALYIIECKEAYKVSKSKYVHRIEDIYHIII